MRRIYIASSWKNKDRVRALAEKLRGYGHEVFDFTDPDNRAKELDHWNCPADKWDGPPLETMEYQLFLTFPKSQRIFTADMGGLHWADTVILLLPSGRSSHLEAGFGAAAGKDLFVFGDLPLGEFDPMYHMAKRCFHAKDEFGLIEALNNYTNTCAWYGSHDHLSKDCKSSMNDSLRRALQAVADPLIEGDYIGSLRGEVNVCLNVIHALKAFREAAKERLPEKEYDELLRRSYVIRAKNWGRLPW